MTDNLLPALDSFAGRWFLNRIIDDRNATQPASFSGEAEFLPAAQGLQYCERGVLHLPGHEPIRAERSYLWRSGANGIDVHFSDGRFFHRIDANRRDASHWCDPDSYEVTYDFTRWPEWTSIWTVRGPRKNYAMTSRYSRPG